NVSAGHTIAGLADLTKAVSQGLRQLTHLCNAMPGIHHREIGAVGAAFRLEQLRAEDRKSTRLNSSHVSISYAVFCLKKNTISYSLFFSTPTHPRCTLFPYTTLFRSSMYRLAIRSPV